MKISLLEGRDFTNRDTAGTLPVVIVNEKVARAFWPNGNATGQRLTFDDPRRNPRWLTIAGVIKNVKQSGWADSPDYECYVPFLQTKSFLEGDQPWVSYMTLVVRTSGDPLHSAKLIQNTVWSIDKNLPLSQVQTMNQIIAQSVWQPRFNLLLVGLFAALALVLSAIGIYGVMAYSVKQRTHEIGIRMALGARRADVLRLVVGEGMALAAIGAAAGLAGALALTRLLAGLLYQVQATDPLIFALVPGVFIGVAFVASYIPARRATRIDPLLALQWE